jgi:hypothetical protein
MSWQKTKNGYIFLWQSMNVLRINNFFAAAIAAVFCFGGLTGFCSAAQVAVPTSAQQCKCCCTPGCPHCPACATGAGGCTCGLSPVAPDDRRDQTASAIAPAFFGIQLPPSERAPRRQPALDSQTAPAIRSLFHLHCELRN